MGAYTHCVPLVAPDRIESLRVVVRVLEESDLPSLLVMNSNAEVTALLPYATCNGLADGKVWYDRMRAIEAEGTALQFVIVSKSAKVAIGTCLLFRLEEASGRAELGYVLRREYWGQGLMREALAELLRAAFDSMGLRR